MRFLFCALFILLQIISGPSRKELLLENLSLKSRVDSLSAVIDSLLTLRTEPEEAAAPRQEESVAEKAPEYSQAVTDSLMDIWYNTRKPLDLSLSQGYDMDSVKFASNVPDDVMIQRLKDINAFITLPFNSTVKNYMILYSEKMHDQMGRILGLAEFYFPIFEEILAKYDMPLELKYMAIIESKLNPVAQSRAGARGMWQFMYGTAKAYGLKITSFIDERLDVEKAADAAARYLLDSYKVFGDWNLAISSYNCGAGNVQKAIRRAGSREFWSIYPFLPRETRGYVPAFVGAMYAMNYFREYGIQSEEVGMPAVTDTFEIKKNLHFKQIDEVVGISTETLKNLNPQYTHDIIPGNSGTCILKLPYNCSAAFMAADPDSLYNHKLNELMSPQILKNIETAGNGSRIAYKVKSGDYLGRIAARYNVSVKQLMKWNRLKNTNLRIGQIIYIYK